MGFRKGCGTGIIQNPLLKSGDAKMVSEASPEDKDSWSPPGNGEIIEFGLCDWAKWVFFFKFFKYLCAKKAMENTLIDS